MIPAKFDYTRPGSLDEAVRALADGAEDPTVIPGGRSLLPLLSGEPVAALDPLARRHFLATLAEAVAAGGLTVMLSSHLVFDLERVCDHLVLLAASAVQLCGDIDALLGGHQVLVGPRKDTAALEKTHAVVRAVHTERQTTLLVRGRGPVADPAWESDGVGLEELVLGYMDQPDVSAPARLAAIGERR